MVSSIKSPQKGGVHAVKLADAHAHLADIENLDDALYRAANAGVNAILAVGVNHTSNEKTLHMAACPHPSGVKIFAALGLHPWGLTEESIQPTLLHITQNIRQVKGVGEVGLDYWLREVRKDPLQKRIQQEAFKRLIDIARRFDKPLTVHSRGAWEDCFTMLADRQIEHAVFHWYSGPIPLLKDILNQGYYVSATPAVEYSKEHKEVILQTPLDRLLIETDSPVKYGNVVSEPKDVRITLQHVAKMKKMPERKIADATYDNFVKLYDQA